MNKIQLLGRLTREPEVKQSMDGKTCICNYSLAVSRQFAKPEQQQVDFINIRAIGKAGEFASKWFKKGQLVAVCGTLRVDSYEDKDKSKKQFVYVLSEEQHFAESKQSTGANTNNNPVKNNQVFTDTEDDDSLPF